MLSNTPNNAYQTYIDALGNPYTRKNYEIHFNKFRKSLKATESCDEILRMKRKDLEDKIVADIQAMAKAGASRASIRLFLSAVKKFFVENRAENPPDWAWVKGRVPKESNGKVEDRDYTKDELVKMWTQSDIRKKAILSLLMTGMRKGAIPELRYGNLTKINSYKDKEGRKHDLENHICKLLVYAGTESKYITFLTPEGAKALDAYLETRKTAGETLGQNSPLIRDVFDTMSAKKPRAVTTMALDMAFTRLTRAVGIRPKEKDGERQDRHDVMLFHGIRKYVNHAYVNAGAEPIKKETLIGHKLPGLEKSYLRPTEDELLIEFLKVIPYLTLGREAELKQEVEKLRVETSDIETMKKSYLDMKFELQKEKEERERLYELLYRQGLIKKES